MKAEHQAKLEQQATTNRHSGPRSVRGGAHGDGPTMRGGGGAKVNLSAPSAPPTISGGGSGKVNGSGNHGEKSGLLSRLLGGKDK